MNQFKVISGGQTGADQGGLYAARAWEVETGGYMPLGSLTEWGPVPELAKDYGLEILKTADYRTRTRRCVESADATIWFGNRESRGHLCTWMAWNKKESPIENRLWFYADEFSTHSLAGIASVAKVINIAGNRESKNPGIGYVTEAYCRELFREMLGIPTGTAPASVVRYGPNKTKARY